MEIRLFYNSRLFKYFKNSINVLASETFSAVSAPIQYAAIKAYTNDHSEYINNSKNILKAVGNYVYENLKSNKVLINKPQGGFYLMPEFLNKKFNLHQKCVTIF
jgi:aspartate aminotransferase